MAEEETTGVTEQEAAVPQEDSAAESQQKQEEKLVPLDALQKERAERQKIQDEVRMLKEHLALMASKESPAKAKEIQDDLDNLSDDDVLTVGEAKKIVSRLDNKYRTTLTEVKMSQKYPDYEHVITTYLPKVIKDNPAIGHSLQQTQDYELAYYLAKNSEYYKSDNAEKKRSKDAERILKNAEQSGSLSSVGKVSPIDQAKRYKTMSDEEFMKEVNRNMGYF